MKENTLKWLMKNMRTVKFINFGEHYKNLMYLDRKKGENKMDENSIKFLKHISKSNLCDILYIRLLRGR